MVKYKIVWSLNAEKELLEILTYYIERNKSSRYSKKLHSKLKNRLSKLETQPLLGILVNAEKCVKFRHLTNMRFLLSVGMTVELVCGRMGGFGGFASKSSHSYR